MAGWTARLQQYWDLQFEPDHATSLDGQCEQTHGTAGGFAAAAAAERRALSGFCSAEALIQAQSRPSSRGQAGTIKTFSIGYDAGKAFNELDYARQVAQRFGTDHHDLVLEPRYVRGVHIRSSFTTWTNP
jgi:asparagine synthase (glutamine-hydrolysing)